MTPVLLTCLEHVRETLMGLVACCMVLHCLLTGKWPLAACPRFLTPCALVWPSSTWHLVGLCPTDGAMSAWACWRKPLRQFVREPTRIITDTKGHHTLRLRGQFEDCDESEEAAALLVGQFRRMKICVHNLDKLPRTCRRAILRRVRQAGRTRWCSRPVWDGLVAGPSSTSGTWWSNV